MTYLSKYHTRKNPVLISLKTSKRRKVYHVEQADVILLDQWPRNENANVVSLNWINIKFYNLK